jgi:hypothetical protein
MATLLPNDEVPRDALKGYRIFIFSHDHPHPPHVHFGKGRRFSSWDLASGECRDEGDFSSSEIRTQSKILETYRDAIWRSWNEHWQRQENRG